jgi:hypothetical protein
VALAAFVAGPASAQVQQTYYYSIDLGSDLALSDPGGAGPLDCGDIYVEAVPTLVKDDEGPVGSNVGHPFGANGAPEPTPGMIGSGVCTIADYSKFFDLDAEDQLVFEVYQPTQAIHAAPGPCLSLEPTRLDLSFEDDGPNGWAVSGDVPTTAAPAHGSLATLDEIVIDSGPFGTWSPPTLLGVRNEVPLGLAPDPPGEANDDDVDALDNYQCRYFYWSPDHEANNGLDPGDIFLTDLGTAGANLLLAVDDVNNMGIPDACDVDAWEFVLVAPTTYQQLFPAAAPVGQPTVIGLFSVDSDDGDTPAVDESGGLNPKTIYGTNLLGLYTGLATYSEDVDALTVPEPGTMALLAIGAVGLLVRRRRR